MRYRLTCCLAFAALLFSWIPLHGQIKEYDFYPEFVAWTRQLPRGQAPVRFDAMVDLYRQKLEADHVDPAEIQRRVQLLKTRREDLERDRWNRFFQNDANRAKLPNHNALLASVVEGRKPGTALDIGMGAGRNSLYLAQLGWDVTGIDPADKAMAIARDQAATLHLPLHTETTAAASFDFGHERWDLILYCYEGPEPIQTAAKAIEGLRPGGIVVVEGLSVWYPSNVLLKTFEPLRLVHYEDRIAKPDYFPNEQPVMRLVAEKPARK